MDLTNAQVDVLARMKKALDGRLIKIGGVWTTKDVAEASKGAGLSWIAAEKTVRSLERRGMIEREKEGDHDRVLTRLGQKIASELAPDVRKPEW